MPYTFKGKNLVRNQMAQKVNSTPKRKVNLVGAMTLKQHTKSRCKQATQEILAKL